jgi:hypothetical protein
MKYLSHGLAVKVIDDVEHTEWLAIPEAVLHEVLAPFLVRPIGHEHMGSGVNTVEFLLVDNVPLMAIFAIGLVEPDARGRSTSKHSNSIQAESNPIDTATALRSTGRSQQSSATGYKNPLILAPCEHKNDSQPTSVNGFSPD